VGESYDAVAQSAARAVGAEACHLALYDPEADEMIARRPHYEAPLRPVPRYRFSLESSPASCRVVRSGQPYFTNDPANDPLYSPTVGERGLSSVLTVPVQREGRVLGLVYALNKPGGFSAEDADTLLALAGAFAVTLENIHLYGRERERRLLHESLSELSRALVEALPETSDLGVVLEQMARVVSYQAASALVRDGDELLVSASRGGRAGLSLPWPGPDALAPVLSVGSLAVVPDASSLLAAIGIDASRAQALAAPLCTKKGVQGALVVAFEPGHPVLERDRQLVSAFADHTAVFLEAGTALRRERQAAERAAMLSRVTRLAATTMEAESFLMSSAPEILAGARADRVALYLRHPRTNELVPVAHAGVAAGEALRVWEVTYDLRSEALRPLAERRQGLVLQGEGGAAGARPPSPFSDTRSLVLLPMVFREEVIGALLACRVGPGRSRAFEPSLVGFLGDVAQQVALGVGNARLFATLSQMAATDDLTQLANRRKFSEALRLELARSRRNNLPLALILADIDHLKQINDTHGHPAGDAAIRHVADALQRGRRETDLAARLGGEEFALLLPQTDRNGAVRAAERIRGELTATTVPVVGRVTVSLGVALFPEDGGDETELVARADERLYAAKSGGRNRVVV
jgi:diguanylate cyclase (GGDEF)-like protein